MIAHEKFIIDEPSIFIEGNMFDSTMSCNSMNMTTSMQLAEQCLKQDPTAGEEQAETAQMFEGLEAFAQTIESGLHSSEVPSVM